MNLKYNPWLSLVALLLLALILTLTCTGCTVRASWGDAETETAPRFTRERASDNCTIITDTQTGVQYLYYHAGYGGGLCVLQPGEE